MAGPYYTNSKVDDVDFMEAADLEAIETGFSNVDTDKANKIVPATTGDLAALSAAGDLTDSGKTPPSGEIVGTSDTQTLTGKTVSLADNTISGTTAQFNTALSDGSFATLAGTETLTNKTLTAPNITSLSLGGVSVTATAAELNKLDGVTATTAELNYVDGVTSNIQTQLNARATLTGTQTLTNKTLTSPVINQPLVTALRQKKVALGSATIDLATGDFFTDTITANITYSLSNVPSTGNFIMFGMEITNGGAFTVTLWANIAWPGGSPPSLSSSGTDVLVFYSHDGGSTWGAFEAGKAMA